MRDRCGISRRRMLATFGLAGLSAALFGCDTESLHTATNDADAGIGGGEQGSFWIYNPAGVTTNGICVDAEPKRTMDKQGLVKPPLAAESTARVESISATDLYAEVSDLYYRRGWTDGLPIVPPTEERISALLAGTDLSRDHVVATLGPLGGQATVEKIATNAVMAGCQAKHLPILIAAVEAVSDSAYDLNSVGTTTGPNASMIIVNGPIAEEVDVNSAGNALGRGWRANATIGRALHLIEQNVGGSWPQVSDLSSLGNPAEYSMMLAENEAANPWESCAVEQGFSANQNVVTVVSAGGTQLIRDIGVDAEGFLARVANCISGYEKLRNNLLLVLTPSTASKLASAGWSKEDIRERISERARVHRSQINQGYLDAGGVNLVEELDGEEADENGMVSLPFIASLTIIVAGGVGEKNELIPLWSSPIMRAIQLPAGWDELLES